MSEVLARLNGAPETEAHAELMRCCGSTRWAKAVLSARPFQDANQLVATAEDAWTRTEEADWREAFTHHPRIGDVSRLREKFAATASWSSQEQLGVEGAGEEVIHALARGNREYEERFGFIFLVCATGKSAAALLEILRARLKNSPEDELLIAAGEQAKITRLRLEKLLKGSA